MRSWSPASTFARRVADARDGGPAVLIGVHNALVARLAVDAGFDGGWLSSLEMSATLGIPDRNILGAGEVGSIARSIVNACDLALVVDLDNGYGSVDATVRAVRDLDRSGVAAVCIEDNLFPKTNSFDTSSTKHLEAACAFAHKVSAAVDARSDCLVIARTEGLVAGEPFNQALDRAHHYASAGADLILVHSTDRTGSEAAAVARSWDGEVPLVTVPTAFPRLDARMLGDMGYVAVVYANQVLRAAIVTMRRTLGLVLQGEVRQLEGELVSMEDLLALCERPATGDVR